MIMTRRVYHNSISCGIVVPISMSLWKWILLVFLVRGVVLGEPPGTSQYFRRPDDSAFLDAQYVTALAEYSTQLQEWPEDAMLYVKRGWTYERLCQYAQALQDYDQAMHVSNPRTASSVIPALPKTAFLPHTEDRLRDALWRLYHHASREAHRFLLPSQAGLMVTQVVSTSRNGAWGPDGVITMEPAWNDQGLLCHELFHAVFHTSVFHDGQQDERWGEGFCEAFRYFMEAEFLPPHQARWKAQLDRHLHASPTIIRERMRHDAFFQQYWGPAILVLQESEGTYLQFLCLWKRLSVLRWHEGTGLLDRYFGTHLGE